MDKATEEQWRGFNILVVMCPSEGGGENVATWEQRSEHGWFRMTFWSVDAAQTIHGNSYIHTCHLHLGGDDPMDPEYTTETGKPSDPGGQDVRVYVSGLGSVPHFLPCK